jgi:hypothetical protein
MQNPGCRLGWPLGLVLGPALRHFDHFHRYLKIKPGINSFVVQICAYLLDEEKAVDRFH